MELYGRNVLSEEMFNKIAKTVEELHLLLFGMLI
jgi:hypothetical protein